MADFKQLGVSFHYSLKRILGFPKYFSNHLACEILNSYTFENFINVKILKFFFWMVRCDSKCFYAHKFYFLNE